MTRRRALLPGVCMSSILLVVCRLLGGWQSFRRGPLLGDGSLPACPAQEVQRLRAMELLEARMDGGDGGRRSAAEHPQISDVLL